MSVWLRSVDLFGLSKDFGHLQGLLDGRSVGKGLSSGLTDLLRHRLQVFSFLEQFHLAACCYG